MKTLYLDCSMGAAGDMLTAALLELLPDPDAFVAKLNALGLPGIRYVRESTSKCGITGTHMHVFIDGEEEITCDEGHHHEAESHEHSDELALAHHEYAHFHEHEEHHDHDHEHEHPDEEHHDHDHEHAHPDHEHAHEHDHADHVHDADHAHGQHGHVHRHLSDIEEIVRALPVPEAVKERIVSVYRRIAEAESKVHGRPVSEVHFHEVGALDAVADVTAVCLLIHEIAPDEVIVSPIHVGSGHVHCAHGILPVPAPATESPDVLDALIDFCGGVCGTFELAKGSLTYDPYAGVGFNIAGVDENGYPTTVDASAMGGIIVTYSSSMGATLELGLGEEMDRSISYDNPFVVLPKNTNGTVKEFKWSEFKQAGWGDVEITGEEAAAMLKSVRFKIQGKDGMTGSFNVMSVGALGGGCSAERYFTVIPTVDVVKLNEKKIDR